MPSDRKRQFSKTNPSGSTKKQQTKTQTKNITSTPFERWFKSTGFGHLLVGIWALSGAIATTLDGDLIQSMERQAQTVFFQLRGSVAPPKNIVLLAIDEESLDQGKFYQTDPQTLAYLEPLATWPWKRGAYATVIDRLMAAGAKSVALDIIFDLPSSEAEDEKFRQVLQKYAGRVTLAASYEDDETRQGGLTKLVQPGSFLQTNPMSVGSINYPIEVDGRVHRHAKEFPKLLAQQYPDPKLAKEFYELVATVPSFDQAALKAARLNYPKPKGDNIFFYGPPGTFEVIPFWHVLEPDNWNTYLQKGEYFKDKIVLIGGTATLFQDTHPTPFSETWAHPELMSGLEIHANAIATLLEGRSIARAIPNPAQRGLFVFIGVMGIGFLIARLKHVPIRLGLATGAIITWGGISYVLFVYSGLIVPTTIPIVAIVLGSLSYNTCGLIRDYFTKRNLRRTFKRYSSSPIVQEMLSQQDEFRGLLEERELELLETKLAGRYRIIDRLSAGGFGETFIAQDTLRPGHPTCVVKQLRPASNNPKHWELARRLFITEAEILERLGKHDQIPQLLAYFEEGEEFYLVEEFVSGRPLTNELPLVVPLSEDKVVVMLQELLEILAFVHSQRVIHRDIKPDNIIRRKSDGKLVLIDFGAVKEIRTQFTEGEQRTELTVGIGTKGYMPNEQAAGTPKYNSDIYALGMIAIQALTVLHPGNIPSNPATGEIIWEDKAAVSPELAAIITKMVRYNFRDRYQSATEALEALQPLITALPQDFSFRFGVKDKSQTFPSSLQDLRDSTQPWSESSTPLDPEEATKPLPESLTPADLEDATRPWTESSTPADLEDATRPWTESSTPADLEDATRPWTESSTPPDLEGATMPLPESSTPKQQSPSSEP